MGELWSFLSVPINITVCFLSEQINMFNVSFNTAVYCWLNLSMSICNPLNTAISLLWRAILYWPEKIHTLMINDSGSCGQLSKINIIWIPSRLVTHLSSLLRVLGPSYMVSGTRDNHPPETTLASVYMWKRFHYRPSQGWPRMIIHNSYWIMKCADVPLSLRSDVTISSC